MCSGWPVKMRPTKNLKWFPIPQERERLAPPRLTVVAIWNNPAAFVNNHQTQPYEAPMTAIALALHLFGGVVWVGGMFAAYMCLRPAAGPLEPPQRLTLWRAFFARFLPWVWVSVVLLLVSGYWILFVTIGGVPWRGCAHPHHAHARLADGRAVRLAVPRAVAGVQARRRCQGLADARRSSTASARSSSSTCRSG